MDEATAIKLGVLRASAELSKEERVFIERLPEYERRSLLQHFSLTSGATFVIVPPLQTKEQRSSQQRSSHDFTVAQLEEAFSQVGKSIPPPPKDYKEPDVVWTVPFVMEKYHEPVLTSAQERAMEERMAFFRSNDQ